MLTKKIAHTVKKPTKKITITQHLILFIASNFSSIWSTFHCSWDNLPSKKQILLAIDPNWSYSLVESTHKKNPQTNQQSNKNQFYFFKICENKFNHITYIWSSTSQKSSSWVPNHCWSKLLHWMPTVTHVAA